MDPYLNIFQDEDVGFSLTVTDTDDRTYALFEQLGLQGGGYTWEAIVTALAEMKMPEAFASLRIGAEADNMYVDCPDREVLERLAQLIRDACADHELLKAAMEH